MTPATPAAPNTPGRQATYAVPGTADAARSPGSVDAVGARRALERGAAVVLPNPAPLTCVVAGTVPGAVNTAKGRPAGQPVAVWAHHPGTLDALERAWTLDADGSALARRLLTEERVTLLVPLRPAGDRPTWLAPASKDGWALLFGARWAPVLPVIDPFPVLYVSSANRTGHPPAAGAAEALAMFPAGTPVLAGPGDPAPAGHGDADGGPGGERRATTTLRLHSDGRIDLYRHGAQDHACPDAGRYLDHLRAAHPYTGRNTADTDRAGEPAS